MKAKTFFIYAICCPDTGCPVYVGRTKSSLKRRLNAHIRTSLRRKLKDSEKERWISSLVESGKTPTIECLSVETPETFRDAERRWIRVVSSDYRLLNISRGGDGDIGTTRYKWAQDHIDLIGKISDSRLAKLVGCTRKAVCYHRESLGIPASNDRTLSKNPPICKSTVMNSIMQRQDVMDRLGKESDISLSVRAGCSKHTIARIRKMLGIEPWAKSAMGNSGRFGEYRKKERTISVTDSCVPLLGTMPDKKLATLVGVNIGIITRLRYLLNIKSYRSTRRKK